jgi:formamidopyrimidine-DNA glycosylase
MPEYPDIELYVDALRRRIEGVALEAVRLTSPFVLRSVEPPLAALHGRRVEGLRRIGKRIVLVFDDDLFLVVHLMIAGRLRWRDRGAVVPRKLGLAAFDFDRGTLVLTEAGSKKRASVHVVRGEDALAAHDPGGLEVVDADRERFLVRLRHENRTLKRFLTDPRLVSGVGNAYSDEILHRARLSPTAWTGRLDDDAADRLWRACRTVLRDWRARLIEETGADFPERVTAFRPGMAVHGRYGEPCPACADPVQRIRYADRELNYCATCQTGGRLLADRGLSRLLGKDWPRTLDELEQLKSGR